METIVCDCKSKICMVHRCDKCPETNPLRQYLETLLEELDQITFQLWQTTNRSKMVTQSLSADEFIDLLVWAIDNLTSHSFIAKCQAKYLQRRKEELADNCALVLVAENYSFVVQDEIQSFQQSKSHCTLHPVVVYYNENGKLARKSLCFISEYLEHDTEFVL